MDTLVLRKLIMYLVICIIFIILAFFYVKVYVLIKNEKRLKPFILENKANDYISISDHIINFFQKIVSILSKILKKSHFLNNYANHFKKYLIYNKSDNEVIDYISIKFLVMIFVQVLYVLSIIIKLNKFNGFTFLLASIVSFFVVDFVIIFRYYSEKKKVEEGLLQAIVIMNSAFKSGKNITGAITIVKEELPSPIKEEFEIVATDISYGLSVQEAFKRFSSRVNIEEAKYITSSLALLNKTGGSIVNVFTMIERNFYNRLKIKNELSSLTSTSKLLYRILIVIPIFLILVIILLNPTYFTPLISTKIGYVIDVVMLFIYIFYIIVIHKLMKVENV